MENKRNCKEVLIWDSNLDPPKGSWVTILWNKFSNNQETISIPKIVEEKKEELRNRFLSWLYEFSISKIHNKKLIDHLQIREGLSYWWMTILAQKNYDKSPNFYNAVKLFVLDDLCKDLSINKIRLASNNKIIIKTIKNFSSRSNFIFKIYDALDEERAIKIVDFLNKLPNIPKALIFLCSYCWECRHYNSIEEELGKNHSGEILVVDYFANFNIEAFKKGEYNSKYWTSLTKIFCDLSLKINWFHLFIKYKDIPNRKTANHLIEEICIFKDKLNNHIVFEFKIQFRMFIRILMDFLFLVLKRYLLITSWKNFLVKESSLDFWPLFKDEWLRSLCGSDGMNNCIKINIIEKALELLPRQKVGLYLQENQPWEFALIYAWRKFKHGHLIGVPHTTVRYWDLRYFNDKRFYSDKIRNGLPLPDKVAVNGRMAGRSYVEGGYPAKNIIGVEALRFLYINNMRIVSKKRKKNQDTNILVCLDLLEKINDNIYTILLELINISDIRLTLTIKPHPVCTLKVLSKFSSIFYVSNEPINYLIGKSDIVITSNITSASVDAYCCGLPVIQILDGSIFNMSPLRGVTNVFYASNARELYKLIKSSSRQNGKLLPGSLFFLNCNLNRWRRALERGMQMGLSE